ncbi:MAG: hypothetical protein Q9175_003418 [Cornicularia normoerica]
MEFGHHVIADEQRIPAYPSKFNIDLPYQFGLELSKATRLFDDKPAHGAHFVPTAPGHMHKLADRRDGSPMRPKFLEEECRWREETTAASPEEEDILAAQETSKNVLAAAEYNSTASTSDMAAAPAPMNGSAIPETASVSAAGMSQDEVTESSERALDVSAIDKSSANNEKAPLRANERAYCLTSGVMQQTLLPSKSQLLQHQILPASRKIPEGSWQDNLVAEMAEFALEKEAPGGHAGVAEEDGEDMVVFVNYLNKVAKVADEPLEEPNKERDTGVRETGRSPRGERGRWKFRYAN